MRIAFITNNLLPQSSIGRMVLNLAKKMKEYGHKIHIFTVIYDQRFANSYGINDSELDSPKILAYLEKIEGVPLLGIVFTMIKFMLMGGLIIPKLKRIQPDIINSHYYFCGISGQIASKIVQIPHVLTLHGLQRSKMGINIILFWVLRGIVSYLSKRVNYLISVDPNLRREEELSQIADHIEIIFPCIDEHFFTLIRNYGINRRLSKDVKLIYVGRIEKIKGLEKLIKILGASSGWRELRVVGTGNFLNSLRALAEQLNISEKVKFFGFRDGVEKVKLMKESDIFISCSRSEGFPLAILEFFALGKPVIIYPIAPFINESGKLNAIGREVYKEKLCIFMNPNISHLEDILNPSYLTQFFSSNCIQMRKAFVKNFSSDTIAERYLLLFSQVLNSYKK
ncbi:MAG: glycosyltransferase family 4 protein [Candidatus Helarchaeota archaeon]